MSNALNLISSGAIDKIILLIFSYFSIANKKREHCRKSRAAWVFLKSK